MVTSICTPQLSAGQIRIFDRIEFSVELLEPELDVI